MSHAPADAIGVREQGKLQTRLRLRVAAKELFEERGYDDVTVAEIAARARVSRKTLFQHFGSKEELLMAELDAVHEDLLDTLRERDLSQTPLEAVTAWLIEWAARRPSDAFERFVRMVGSGPSVEAMRRRLYEDWENALAAVLADEANEARATPRTRLTAAQLVAMIRVLTSPEQRALIERYPPERRPQAYREAVLDAAAHLAGGLGHEA
jgi:AcrR family transcriptional regulator